MDTAKIFAELSHAQRLHVGAIVVKDDRIISIGYNGMPSGWSNVCENHIGNTKPEVIHAEANAIAKLAKSNESGNNSVAFITHAPCMECAKLLVQSGIIEVYYLQEYRDTSGLNFLDQSNVKVHKVKLKERKDIDFGTEL